MPDEVEWITLYNPTTQGTHRVPDNAGVIEDFRARGWESSDDTDVRAEAVAGDLRGKALDGALDAADLSKSGSVAEKQARLAEHEAELAAATITQEEEGLTHA